MTRTQLRTSLLGTVLVILGVAACSDTEVPGTPGSSTGEGDAGAGASTLTYYRDVKPIVDAKCTQCHVAGGIAPFTLTSADDVRLHKDDMAADTAARKMPPWPPGQGCTDYTGDRSLTDAQIATLGAWAHSDAALGDPAETVPLPPSGDGMTRIDRTLTMPEAYTPQTRPDDYRCFVLDWNEAATKFVVGAGATPGHANIVHHMLAFAIDPADVAAFEKFDSDEPGPGYTCFGGPSASGAATIPVRQITGWAPGSTGKDFPAGTGIRIDPGSKIVIQVHYNTLNADPVPDQTGLTLALADAVSKEAFVMPWSNPLWSKTKSMSIDADNPDTTYAFAYDALNAVSTFTKGALNATTPLTVYSAALHMHLLGTSGTIEVQHPSGDNECLLTIPHWNFHWQGSYGFTTPKQVNPGDKFSIACHWDNSAANQPIVGGVQSEPPKAVNWGEGSTDEMCLGYLYLTQ